MRSWGFCLILSIEFCKQSRKCAVFSIQFPDGGLLQTPHKGFNLESLISTHSL